MAFNEKTQQYDEYPRSQFPGKVDDWVNKQDIPITLHPIMAQYQTAWDNMDVDTMESLQSQYPALPTYLFSASDINQAFDGIKALQQFFKDDVEVYLKKIGQYKVGISDNPTEEEKITTAYSSQKTDELTGITIATNIKIPKSSWVSVERSDGFKYRWTYTNERLQSTDRVMVYFDNASLIPASKANIAIDDTSADGTVSFISIKVPKTDLTIKMLEMYRK